jgi:hypothetical protein
MVRRVLKTKRFKYEDARNQTRHDKGHFDWLVENGFFADVGGGYYEVTDKGKASADLGFYEYEPKPRPADAEPTRRRKSK